MLTSHNSQLETLPAKINEKFVVVNTVLKSSLEHQFSEVQTLQEKKRLDILRGVDLMIKRDLRKLRQEVD